MDELASATKVADVIARVTRIVGEGQHTLDSGIIHAIEGIDKHRVAMCIRNVETDETQGGNNKVI